MPSPHRIVRITKETQLICSRKQRDVVSLQWNKISVWLTWWRSWQASTVAWKRGHRKSLRTKRLFITRSTWQNPALNESGLSENAFTKPFCKEWNNKGRLPASKPRGQPCSSKFGGGVSEQVNGQRERRKGWLCDSFRPSTFNCETNQPTAQVSATPRVVQRFISVPAQPPLLWRHTIRRKQHCFLSRSKDFTLFFSLYRRRMNASWQDSMILQNPPERKVSVTLTLPIMGTQAVAFSKAIQTRESQTPTSLCHDITLFPLDSHVARVSFFSDIFPFSPVSPPHHDSWDQVDRYSVSEHVHHEDPWRHKQHASRLVHRPPVVKSKPWFYLQPIRWEKLGLRTVITKCCPLLRIALHLSECGMTCASLMLVHC